MDESKIPVIDIPYESDNFKCPVCEAFLTVMARVKIAPGGEVRRGGENGFRNFIYNVNLKTEIQSFHISHECDGPTKEK